jgi:hypothetical protein
MKSTGLLSSLLFVLSAAIAAHAETVPTGDGTSSPPPGFTLAAAGGHDSVGGLIPLSLWPPYTPRVYAPAPRVWKHRSRRCIANACRR